MPETSSPVQPITRRGFGVLVGAASSGVAMAAGAASAGAATRVRSHGPSVSSEPFGSIDEGPVRIYTLTNGHGVRVRILNYGGIIQSVEIPDRRGRFANVALGFDNIDDYVAKSPYFGCITGRYANRIAKGTFTLDGVTYHLPINNDPNTVANVKLGDRIEIPESDISDWLYMRDGKMVGNLTLKPLFREMPAAEVEQLKKMMADP